MSPHIGQKTASSADIHHVIGVLTELRTEVVALKDTVCELRQTIDGCSNMKDFYSSSEVAAILGLSRYTVQERYCNQGRIDCEKDPAGKWRIPASEVERLRRGNGPLM